MSITEILCRYCSDPIYQSTPGTWEDPYNSNYPTFCGANPADSARHEPRNQGRLVWAVIYFNSAPCYMVVDESMPAT